MRSLRFWKPTESFFVLEILPNKVNGLLLGLDADQKLTPRKFFEDTDWAHLSKRLDLRRLVKNIIVAVDSSLAYTAIIPVSLQRESSGRPLSAVELENLLAQEVGKLFNQCRQDASAYLKVDDLDVILVNSRVMNFKIDGHRVLNPLEFRATKIEAVLELILTTRAVFSDIKIFTKERQDLFFTEIARSELNVLQKVHDAPLSILHLGEEESAYAVLESLALGQTVARGRFPWTTGTLVRSLESAWLINFETAEVIYRMYVDGELTPTTGKAVQKILAPAEKSIYTALAATKFRGPVFVESDRPLPFRLPLKKYGRNLMPPPLDELFERFGFRIDWKEWTMGRESVFRLLAPFWDYYYDRSDSTVNRWLKRHLNWLGTGLIP